MPKYLTRKEVIDFIHRSAGVKYSLSGIRQLAHLGKFVEPIERHRKPLLYAPRAVAVWTRKNLKPGCANCGAPIEVLSGGRHRKHCSHKCRIALWKRTHRRHVAAYTARYNEERKKHGTSDRTGAVGAVDG